MKKDSDVIVQQMGLGPMDNFLYFIGDAKTKEIAVVDPAWDVDFLCDEADKNGYKITAVFLTHGHPDHTNGVAEMVKRHPVPVYISKHEIGILKPRVKNLVEVEDRANLKTGNLEWECLLTPGHSPGCHCFKHGDILIAGDTLFIDGCGRCDLPGSDPKKMYNSLYNVVMKLPDSTLIYPGHNYGPTPYATLASQKKTNPYLTCKGMEEFLVTRMGIAF